MTNWKENRDQLKKDICAYFQSHNADKSKLIKILDTIKFIAEVAASFDDALGDEEYLRDEARVKFSPRHRKAVFEFLKRATNSQLELTEHLKKQRYWQDPDRCWARDDFELEDYEDSLPKAEILITYEEIIVHSFEWQDGFKEHLPKGGKYQGKGTGKWTYPVSSRPELEKLGLPIIKYPGIE